MVYWRESRILFATSNPISRPSVGVGGATRPEEMRAGQTRALLLRHLHLAASDVVSQQELSRVRTQVDLSG